MKKQPIPTSEKIIYVCFAIVIIYIAIKTGYDLSHNYQSTL